MKGEQPSIIAASALGGPAGALLGAGVAGLVYVAVALAIRAFGVGWLLRLLPPIVVGPVIIVIGLGLSAVAVKMATNTAAGGPYSLGHFGVALFTLASIFVYSLVLKGFFTVVPILLGRGVRLWDGLEGMEQGYAVEVVSTPSGVTHLVLTR